MLVRESLQYKSNFSIIKLTGNFVSPLAKRRVVLLCRINLHGLRVKEVDKKLLPEVGVFY
jgi:DNA-nicking Smr family endonuclease